jgi:hypothetical protein
LNSVTLINFFRVRGMFAIADTSYIMTPTKKKRPAAFSGLRSLKLQITKVMITQNPSTPSSNTGLECQTSTTELNQGLTVRLDWVQLVGEFSTVDEFIEVCEFVVGCFDDVMTYRLETPRFMGKQFDGQAISARGILGLWANPTPYGHPGSGWISIPGTVLARRSLQRVWGTLYPFVFKWGMRATRLDIAVDDFDKRISFDTVVESLTNRNYARFERFRIVEDFNGKVLGKTIYLGSRNSDKFVRFYDKSVESDGEIDSYRWELQSRGKHSEEILKTMLSLERPMDSDACARYLGSLVVGAVDFVDRESGDRLQRQVRLDWWQQFVDLVGNAVRVSLPKKETLLIKTVAWFYRQVCTSMAMFREVLGPRAFGEWFRSFVETGQGRFEVQHFNRIQVAREDWGYSSTDVIGL